MVTQTLGPAQPTSNAATAALMETRTLNMFLALAFHFMLWIIHRGCSFSNIFSGERGPEKVAGACTLW